ncbi:MAG TPA: translocation/assembly module TamB domain-containing protein, partial [bacterium]|nr:translocation/assembly module TamB domain-containing protein [bacterium]
ADLEGRLTGTVNAPVVSGAVTAWDGRLGLVPFDLATGDVDAGPQRIGSSGLALVRGGASYDVSGEVGLHPLFAEGVSVQARGVPAGPLAHALVPAIDVSGTLAGRIAVAGPLAHPAVSGTVAFAQGTVSGQRIDAASIEFAGTGGQVRIESFSAAVNDSRLDASGLVDFGGAVDLAFTADRIHLSDIPSLGQWGLALAGTVSLSGQVTGTMKDPELKATVASPGLSINGQAFQASGAIDYRAQALTVAPVSLTQQDQRYGVTGVIKMGSKPTADLNFTVQHGQLATIFRATSATPPVPIAGTIDGTVALDGALADPTAHLVITMQDGQVSGIPVGTGTADLTLAHGVVDIQTLELHPQQGSISAKGRVELEGTSSVELSGQNLDANLLRPLFRMGPKDVLAGTLNFTVQFGGPTRDPTAGLSFQAANAGLPNATVDQIAVLAFYKDGIVTVENGTIDKGTHELALEGTLPVDPSAFGLTPNGPLDLRLSLADTDLSFLTLFTPAIRDASGTIAGDVTIGGTPANPEMTGVLQSHGGRFLIGPLTTPVENLNININFSQSQIELQQLSATMGGGTLTGQGTVSVKDLRPDTVALVLSGTNITVVMPGLYSGGVDGSLSLSGPALRPTLAGTINLSHGTVAVTEAAGPGTLSDVPIRLDASVVLGDSVNYVQGPARARLTGGLHIGGTIGRPVLTGQVQAINGTINILGTPYTVSQGVLTFSEGSGVFPHISVTAQGLYGPTRVFLNVDGVLPTPTLSWTSDPPMSQDQVLALVVGTSGGQSSPAGLLSQVLFGSLTSS